MRSAAPHDALGPAGLTNNNSADTGLSRLHRRLPRLPASELDTLEDLVSYKLFVVGCLYRNQGVVGGATCRTGEAARLSAILALSSKHTRSDRSWQTIPLDW